MPRSIVRVDPGYEASLRRSVVNGFLDICDTAFGSSAAVVMTIAMVDG